LDINSRKGLITVDAFAGGGVGELTGMWKGGAASGGGHQEIILELFVGPVSLETRPISGSWRKETSYRRGEGKPFEEGKNQSYISRERTTTRKPMLLSLSADR